VGVRGYFAPNPTPEPGEAASVNYAGNRLVNAPNYTFNIGASWSQDIGLGKLSARIDYAHVGKVFFELDNILYAPPRGSVDGRVALNLGRVTADIWAKNLLNKRWATSAYGQQQLAFLLYLGPGGPYDSYTTNTGRSWGVSLKVDF
jgi:iron complex outermembrane recepter protein